MKSRVWVLVAFMLLLGVIGGYLTLFRLYNINQKAKDYLSEKVFQTVGADFSSGSVFILPWSLQVKGAKLRLRNAPVYLEVSSIRVGFNILNFIKYPHDTFAGIREVFFDKPCVVWRLDESRGTLRFNDEPSFSLKKIPSLRVQVSNGSFVFQRGDSTFTFADKVSGWVDGCSSPKIDIAMEGRVLSNEINTTCKGVLDRKRNSLSLDLVSGGGSLKSDGIGVVSGDMHPEAGTLDLNLHIERMGDKQTVSGRYSVTGASFLLRGYNIGVTDVYVHGHLDAQEVFLDSLSGKVWGVTPELTGRLSLKPEPSLNLFVQAQGIDIKRALSDIVPEKRTYPEGTIDLSATIYGPLTALKAQVNAVSNRIIFSNHTFQNVDARLTYTGDSFECEKITAYWNGYHLEASGNTLKIPDYNRKDFSVKLSARTRSKPVQRYSVKLSGTAEPDKRTYTSDIELTLHSADETLKGKVSLIDKTMTYVLKNDRVSSEGSVVDVFEKMKFHSVFSFAQFPLLRLFGYRDSGLLLTGGADVKGDFDSLSTDGEIRLTAGKNFNSLLKGNAVVRNLLSKKRSFNMNAQLLDHQLRYSSPMTWSIAAKTDSAGIVSKLVDKEGAVMDIAVLPTNGGLSGALALNGFPLERIIDIFTEEEYSHRGRITGRVGVGGTLLNPVFSSNEPLRVEKLKIGGLDRLEATANVSGGFDNLSFSHIEVSRDNFPIMTAEGTWKKGTPFVFTAQGNNVEFGAFNDIFSATRKSEGKIAYSIKTVFTSREGTISGGFTVKNGHFMDVPFDTASGVLSGGSQGFKVSDFSIKKEGIFTGKGYAASGYFWKDKTDSRGLRMNITLKGDLPCALPYLTKAVEKAEGQCTLDVTIGGTWQEPVVLDGEMSLTGGVIEPANLIDKLTDVNAVLRIDPDFKTVSGLKAVRVINASCLVDGKKLKIKNFHQGDSSWEVIKKPNLDSIVHEDINLDLGIFGLSFDKVRNRETAVKLHVPGFMEKDEKGIFELAGLDTRHFIVGASDAGDHLAPYICGRVSVISGDINYPLLLVDSEKNGDGSSLGEYLEDIFWDLEINTGSNVNYIKEYNFKIGKIAGTTLWKNEIKIDENSKFRVYGRLSDGSFRVTGNARSTYGYMSYYGYTFDIDWMDLELDTDKTLKPAMLTGRAKTVAIDDSTGSQTEIFIHINFVDRESGKITEARGRINLNGFSGDYYDVNRPQTRFDAGALGIIEIRFSSNNPSDDTQEEILARLGISPGSIGVAATRAFTSGIDNYYFNTLLRPFEERIKRMFKLDMVKITPSFLGNFAQSRLGFNHRYFPVYDTVTYNRSRIMLGEFLMKDWFLSYVGQYGVGRDALYRREKGFYHDIGLQYLVERNLRLQLHYNYDEIIKQEDKRIELRYDFEFE